MSVNRLPGALAVPIAEQPLSATTGPAVDAKCPSERRPSSDRSRTRAIGARWEWRKKGKAHRGRHIARPTCHHRGLDRFAALARGNTARGEEDGVGAVDCPASRPQRRGMRNGALPFPLPRCRRPSSHEPAVSSRVRARVVPFWDATCDRRCPKILDAWRPGFCSRRARRRVFELSSS